MWVGSCPPKNEDFGRRFSYGCFCMCWKLTRKVQPFFQHGIQNNTWLPKLYFLNINIPMWTKICWATWTEEHNVSISEYGRYIWLWLQNTALPQSYLYSSIRLSPHQKIVIERFLKENYMTLEEALPGQASLDVLSSLE